MTRVALVAVAALIAAGVAGGASTADPGITATTVLIGGTVPLSGEAAAFGSVAPGAKAYFDWVNARGGVNGRKIEYRYYDDAYNPAQTVQLTRKLVEQDRVAAIFNAVGTANNLAVRDYLNAQKVPQVLAADGSDALGSSPAKYPWTVGFLQSYRGEGGVYGRDLVKRRPKARIAVLFENTELGKDMTRGLSRAIAGKGPKIVASESYEYTAPDVVSQLTKLKASGADTLMLFATPKFMIQAIVATHKLAWKPAALHRLDLDRADDHGDRPAECARAHEGRSLDRLPEEPERPDLGEGSGRGALPQDPEDVRALRAKPTDVYHWYGMTVAWSMVEALQRAGKKLTRASLLAAVRSMNTTANPFMLPGIRLRTSARDSYPIDAVYLYRYDNKQWVKASGLLPTR